MDILYQFTRSLDSQTSVFTLVLTYYRSSHYTPTVGWKSLPISGEDLKRINRIANKTDKIAADHLSIVYEDKSAFSDISLDSTEYRSPIRFQSKPPLHSGYYMVDSNYFAIYNPKDSAVYFEHHYCAKEH